jgi:hypothetical protein
MARLIEVQHAGALPSPLPVAPGDVLLVSATGAHLLSGGDVLELLGPLRSSVLADDGRILSPEGPPNTLLLRALRPGTAAVEIVSGDPWQGATRTRVEVVVGG